MRNLADEVGSGTHTVLELIGNTPLLEFRHVTAHLAPVRVLAKAEWQNPGGSVKDRPALWMIRDGERRGLLSRAKRIIDASSGNTGIAYAMIGAHLGYGVTVALPRNASEERKQLLLAYGAQTIVTDPGEGTDGAQRLVREMVRKDPGRWFYPDQYNNDANWLAHYHTTAEEIWRQTAGQVTHFVTGVGTSGTFVGVTRRLKELNPAIRCFAMQPDSPLHGMEGLKHMATALVPGIYDPRLADDTLEVGTEQAYAMALRLAREEGLLVGVSSGGNMVAALRVAGELREHGRPGVVVTMLCDSAARYLSEPLWNGVDLQAENMP